MDKYVNVGGRIHGGRGRTGDEVKGRKVKRKNIICIRENGETAAKVHRRKPGETLSTETATKAGRNTEEEAKNECP